MIGLTVIARARAKKGREQALEREWQGVASDSKREVGCLQYDLLRSRENPREILCIERWSSREDLDEHLNSHHVKTLLSHFPDLAESEPEIEIYSDLNS